MRYTKTKTKFKLMSTIAAAAAMFGAALAPAAARAELTGEQELTDTPPLAVTCKFDRARAALATASSESAIASKKAPDATSSGATAQ